MKSVRIHALSSSMDNVLVEDVPTPSPQAGQVLIKMRYAPINPSDFNYIRGDYRSALSRVLWNHGGQDFAFAPTGAHAHPEPPYSIGGEGVGVVEAAGGGWMSKRLVGKRVAFAAGPPNGSWQQYTVVDAMRAIPVPPAIEDEQASMYLGNPLSCYAMVTDILKVRPGAWLLQSGAGSALGQMVIRLGKHLGFKTINLVRSQANIAKLKALGADVVIDTSTQDVQGEIHKATAGMGVDCAMDCIGGELLTRMMQCLTVDGHLVVYGTLSGLSNTFYSRDIMMPCARVSGFFVPNWLAQKSTLQKLSTLRSLKKLHLAGIFNTEVDQILPLQEVNKGIQLAATPGQQGKILLDLQA